MVRKRPLTTKRSAPTDGFTLVEILVVLVILAIAAGVAVVAYDGDERGAATREARRLAQALEYAAQRAQARAETLGVSADANGWRFWRRPPASGQWQPVTDDDVLAPHALPAAMVLAAEAYAGQPSAGNIIVPLRPTGRNEPYAFSLRSPHVRIALASDPLNRVGVTIETDVSR